MDRKNEEHLDPRQRKTRALLVKALAELMEERPFSELSVVDICSRAMVHRTTFYAHFNDKQELLHYLMVQVERECIAACVPQDAPTPRQFFLTAARNALAFFKTRKGLYRACMASGADTQTRLLEDAAAEVRALQRKGLRVSAVFMGEDASAADASRIYGKNMARIRGMDQLARAAGRLIQNEIRELGD